MRQSVRPHTRHRAHLVSAHNNVSDIICIIIILLVDMDSPALCSHEWKTLGIRFTSWGCELCIDSFFFPAPPHAL